MARWTSWKQQARSRPSALTVSPPASRWIYRPAVDLIVGCGAWSAPLLLVTSRSASGATRFRAVLFFLLAPALNYPHYMATVYRAYHTRTEFEKYRLFTFHITTFLVVMGAASHIRGSGSQLETVRSAQAEVESAHPGATSAAGQAQAVADALARYPPGLAP